jgi:glycosyltransferase involved in cell wall biosynthesis
MRVLWITNTPSLSQEITGEKIIAGGWIASLEKKITEYNSIELAIAFYSKKNIEPFYYNKSKYYPICSGRERFLYRLRLWMLGSYITKRDLFNIKSIISDFKPDIIHVHGTELGFGMIAEHTDLPVVISIQGNLSVIQRMYYRGFSKSEIFKYSSLKGLLNIFIYWKDFIKIKKRSKFEREILSECRFVIGRTEWDRRITSILAPKSSYFHNDEIMRDLFYEKTWGQNYIKKQKFIIHTTTSSPLYKGLETICETAALLDRNNTFDFSWNIVGLNKNDAIVSLCKRKFSGDYFDRRLNFLGIMNSTDLVNQMYKAHLYVTTSHIENSSNSLCEAMLLGMPCTASFAGGTDTIIKAGIEGLLFQDGDSYSLAGVIMEAQNNYDAFIIMGLKAREKAMARHGKNNVVDSLLKIYSQIILK